jgi:hypothetical protein
MYYNDGGVEKESRACRQRDAPSSAKGDVSVLEPTFGSQIKSLEIQLAVLKAQVMRESSKAPVKTLGELYGLLASAGTFSEEEIESALYGLEGRS